MSYAGSDRPSIWKDLGTEHFDLLVVGGGITGAGIARDAATRGLSVALVDQGDFGSGTSSRSSRLVHGGLRYLENYEFRLVFESTHERARLMRLAPHLVRPLPFVFPVFRGAKPGMFMLRAGMILYDLLASFRNYRRHRRLSARRLAEAEPALRREDLRGGFRFFDCHTDDARLTLENVLGAVGAGASCLNYVRFVAARTRDGEIAGAELEDATTGERTTARAAVIVCAVGPWLDPVLRAFGDTVSLRLRPSKGVHIVLPHDRLPAENAIVMTAVRDHRAVFCIPWNGATYVGTTDTAWSDADDVDAVFADANDVAYLLETANHYFPDQKLVPGDVTGTWAGLRPLVDQDADSTYRVSREHVVAAHPSGLVVIAGGKLTTYRKMAAEATDEAAKLLRARRPEQKIPKSRTGSLPLPGGVGLRSAAARDALRDEIRRRAHVDATTADHLFGTYGARVTGLLDLIAEDASLREPIAPGLPYVWAELAFAAAAEMVVHLEDFLLRRTMLLFKTPDGGHAAARSVAQRLTDALGWDEARVAEELARYDELAAAHMACVRG